MEEGQQLAVPAASDASHLLLSMQQQNQCHNMHAAPAGMLSHHLVSRRSRALYVHSETLGSLPKIELLAHLLLSAMTMTSTAMTNPFC